MKRRTLFVLPAAGLGIVHGAAAEAIRQGERDRALSHFHATRKLFLDFVAPRTAAEWVWKPAPDRWSLEEVAEHIALSEETIFQLVRTTLKQPAGGADAEQRKKDDLIVRGVPQRTTRVQAPEMLVPRKSFATRQETVAAFLKARDRNIAYVRETQDDLREHTAPHPALGPLDCYQWLLLISAHSERHVAQMKEVTEAAGFPKA